MIENLIKSLKEINKDVLTKDEVEFFLRQKMEEIDVDNEPIEENGVKLIPISYDVIIDGERCHFRKKEFKVLHMLLKNPNKCITRDMFLEKCWEDDIIVDNRTIDVHIAKIKKKLKGKINIFTQKGIGYKFKSR